MQNNIWKLYAGTILDEMSFLMAIIVPYLGSFGLSMTENVITEVIYTATILLLEIPSGYFADIYGRKKSMIIGISFVLIGLLFYTVGNKFLIFCLGGAIWGIGTSFISGANEALLYDTLVELKRENEYKKISGDLFFYGRLSAIFAGIVGGFLANISLIYTFYATLIPNIICLFIFISLNETRYHEKKLITWNHFKNIIKESFLHNDRIKYFVIFTGVIGFLNIDFWFKQKYMEFINIPIFYFGIILGIVPLFSGLGSKYAEKIEKYLGFKKAIFLIPIFPIIIWILMGTSKTLLIIPLMIIINFFWGFSVPIFNDYLQKLITSDRRATIMSLMSLFRRGVFTIFSPFLGWITDVYSIQTAFLILALMASAFTLVNYYFLRKVKII